MQSQKDLLSWLFAPNRTQLFLASLKRPDTLQGIALQMLFRSYSRTLRPHRLGGWSLVQNTALRGTVRMSQSF